MLSESRKRNRFIEAALSYKGTRFIHQGRDPHVGLDCAGLIECAAKEAGYLVDPPHVYRRIPRPAVLMEQLSTYCVPADNDGSPGLIHLMRSYNSVRMCHLSMRVNEHTILESSTGCGVVENDYNPELVVSTWVLRE